MNYLKKLEEDSNKIRLSIENVKKYRRQIHKLKEQLSQGQIKKFNMICPDIESLDESNLKSSLDMIQRTIESNKKNLKEIKQKAKKYKKEVETEFGLIKELSIDQVKDVSNFIEDYELNLEKEIEEKNKVDITKGLEKSTLKLEYPKFDSEEEAIAYFKNCGYEYFELGQGIYKTESQTYCFIKDVFFLVNIEAEVLGKKMDVGDKFYWVESIENVSFTYTKDSTYLTEQQKIKEDLIKQKEEELRRLKA